MVTPGCGTLRGYLMELLVNGLLRQGARRERLEAKLFGGARTMEGLADIGALERGLRGALSADEGGSAVARQLAR